MIMHLAVLTDASLMQDRTGIDILIMDDHRNALAKLSIRLSNNISIYKAELHVIPTALNRVLDDGYNGQLTIYTDTMSCVQSIGSRHSHSNSTALENIYSQAVKFTSRLL